jgi:hypothetical protein
VNVDLLVVLVVGVVALIAVALLAVVFWRRDRASDRREPPPHG